MYIQKPTKGRIRLSPNVIRTIASQIESLAYQHNCSKSFVTTTLLANQLNIKLDENYYDYKRVTRKARKSA